MEGKCVNERVAAAAAAVVIANRKLLMPNSFIVHMLPEGNSPSEQIFIFIQPASLLFSP